MDSAAWFKVGGKDIAGQGDVEKIKNWPSRFTLDGLKGHVVSNNYSGFALGKDGTWVQKTVFFKKVDYRLTPAHTKPNKYVHGIWIRAAQDARLVDLRRAACRPHAQLVDLAHSCNRKQSRPRRDPSRTPPRRSSGHGDVVDCEEIAIPRSTRVAVKEESTLALTNSPRAISFFSPSLEWMPLMSLD